MASDPAPENRRAPARDALSCNAGVSPAFSDSGGHSGHGGHGGHGGRPPHAVGVDSAADAARVAEVARVYWTTPKEPNVSRRETSPEISGALRRGGRARISRPTPQVSNASTPGFQPEDCRHTAKSSPVGTKEYEPGAAYEWISVGDERKRDGHCLRIESRQGRQIIAHHFSGGNPRVPQTTSPVGTADNSATKSQDPCAGSNGDTLSRRGRRLEHVPARVRGFQTLGCLSPLWLFSSHKEPGHRNQSSLSKSHSSGIIVSGVGQPAEVPGRHP